MGAKDKKFWIDDGYVRLGPLTEERLKEHYKMFCKNGLGYRISHVRKIVKERGLTADDFRKALKKEIKYLKFCQGCYDKNPWDNMIYRNIKCIKHTIKIYKKMIEELSLKNKGKKDGRFKKGN
ncbi:MAG: hypothetical protein WC783_04375 [Candidatus Paceibacterota bacterium]|jgi:hypothetical protein